MREVVVLRYCDGDHLDKVEAGISREETIGGEPVVLDFCEPCDEAFEKDLATLRAWLVRGIPASKVQPVPKPRRVSPSGKRIGRPRKEDLTRKCNQPGCEEYQAPTRSALGQHLKQKHQMTLAEAGLTA